MLGNTDLRIYRIYSLNLGIGRISTSVLAELKEKLHLHGPVTGFGHILFELIVEHSVQNGSPVNREADSGREEKHGTQKEACEHPLLIPDLL